MPTPPYPLLPQPMKKTWIEHHPYWKIVLGGLTLILLVGTFAIIVTTVVTTSFRNSEAYKQAVAKASQNPQVREAIGEPIHPAWLVSGQLNITGSTGNANLLIPISGPQGKGSIRAVASKSGGVWRFTDLQVNIAGHSETIDLLSIQPPAERDF